MLEQTIGKVGGDAGIVFAGFVDDVNTPKAHKNPGQDFLRLLSSLRINSQGGIFCLPFLQAPQSDGGANPHSCPAMNEVHFAGWDVFDYIFESDRRRLGRIKPARTYRNPIFLAREWAEAMEGGKFRSQRAFARAIGLSHARVSQVLGLLRLFSGAQQDLEALGDPLYSRKVTERKLRPIINLQEEKQALRLGEML